jgi:hypothetical protein
MTGGSKFSWLAAVGGFFIAPAAVGLASGLAAIKMSGATPQKIATVYAGGHLAGLGAAWWAQKRYPQARSFLRGAMYGEGVVGTLAVMGAVSVVNIPVQAPGTTTALAAPAAGDTAGELKALAAKLVTGGFIRK